MNTFMAILSQLFWGVTIGALSAAFQALAQIAIVIVCLGGGGWFLFKRHKNQRKISQGKPKD